MFGCSYCINSTIYSRKFMKSTKFSTQQVLFVNASGVVAKMSVFKVSNQCFNSI